MKARKKSGFWTHFFAVLSTGAFISTVPRLCSQSMKRLQPDTALAVAGARTASRSAAQGSPSATPGPTPAASTAISTGNQSLPSGNYHHPGWGISDCSQDGIHYHFLGSGTAVQKTDATSLASLDARRSAMACIFGPSLHSSATTTSSNTGVHRTESVTVELTAEHIKWELFEILKISEDYHEGRWTVRHAYRWPVSAVRANQTRADELRRRQTENQRQAERLALQKDLLAAQDRRLREQARELASLKRNERELALAENEHQRLLVRMTELKILEKKRDDSWIAAVQQFGCGVTIRHLTRILGKPDRKDVRGYHIKGTFPREYTPVILYHYGNFALFAPVPDEKVTDGTSWDHILRQEDRWQIEYAMRWKGGDGYWEICRSTRK